MFEPGAKVRSEALPHDLRQRIVAELSGHVSLARQARLKEVLRSRSRDLCLVLEDVANEHNGAAVLRTADAFGIFEVQVIEGGTPFSVAKKVSSGSHKWLDLRRAHDSDEAYAGLRARGYQIWAACVHGEARPISEIEAVPKIALVFGNEMKGLSAAASSHADGRFVVPMLGFVESLNISVAAAIACWDLSSRMRAGGSWSPLSEAEQEVVYAAWLATGVRAADLILRRAGLPVPVLYDRAPPREIDDGGGDPPATPEDPRGGNVDLGGSKTRT